MTTRVYVPATLALLAEWHEAGAIPGHVGRLTSAAGDEDSEYAALMTAAGRSARLGAAGGRRVVVVAEAVATGPIAMRDVVAVHCDTDDRSPDSDPGDDLAWFATQEIPHLI